MTDALLEAARDLPTKEAIVTQDERLSYADLLGRAYEICTMLHNASVKRGDRVVLFMDNSASVVAAIYGIWFAGAVSVVVNPQTKRDKLNFILNDAGASFLIADRLLTRVFEPAARDVGSLLGIAVHDNNTISVLGADQDKRIATDRTVAPVFVNPLDLAALIYTSGSTGNPKGVMMTHQNMVFTSGSLVEYLRLGSDDRIMNVLPLAFDYGLYQALMSVHLGATLVLERNFSFPVSILNRAAEERVTVFPGVPTVFASLVSLQKREPRALEAVRTITNTAAHLPDDFVPTLKGLFPNGLVFKMYGLTECKRVCYLEPELVDAKPGSVGRAIPGTETFLLDDDGNIVPNGGEGTLYVRGPHVMKGYWNLPEQTAHMLKPGWLPGEVVLCTHDRFRTDEDGFLYFEGRSDDIIKSRGEKVSPVEVENALHSIPGVREAAVVGEPDELLGQAVIAYVVLEDGAELGERELKRAAMGLLEGYMVPASFRFLSEMPKTDSGKVRKKSLLEGDVTVAPKVENFTP